MKIGNDSKKRLEVFKIVVSVTLHVGDDAFLIQYEICFQYQEKLSLNQSHVLYVSAWTLQHYHFWYSA